MWEWRDVGGTLCREPTSAVVMDSTRVVRRQEGAGREPGNQEYVTQLHGQRSNHLLRVCVCVGRVSSLSVAQREVLPRLFLFFFLFFRTATLFTFRNVCNATFFS